MGHAAEEAVAVAMALDNQLSALMFHGVWEEGH
jgi:hypothetical protein